MKKRSLVVMLALLAMVTACGRTSSSETPSSSLTSSSETSVPDSSSQAPSSSLTPSSSEEPVSSEVPSEVSSEIPSSEPPSSEDLYIEDPDPTPTYADETPATTRDFNPLFDKVLDDFSAQTMKGTGTGNYLEKPYLLANIDNSGEEKAGNTPDRAIYKFATGTYELHTYQLGFRLKLVAGSFPLSQLKLGLRGDDAWDVYEIPFSELLDADAEPLPALSASYHDYLIDLNNSISDDTVEYKIKGTANNSGTRVLNKVLGLHLMASANTVAKIAVEQIYLVKAGEVTVIDAFNRLTVNAPDPSIWWRDSVGSIVPRNVMLNEGTTYQVSDEVAAEGYANIAATVKGDMSLALVKVVKADDSLTEAVNWTALKDADNNALPVTMHGFKTVIINYEKSGLGTDVIGLFVQSTNKMSIRQLFFTNLDSREAAKQYPYLSLDNIVKFDDFSWEQVGMSNDYEVASTDPDITGAGLYYALSYSHGDKVSVTGGQLVIDATTLAENDYINFKEASSRANLDHKYLVLSVKGTDGATLAGLRIGTPSPIIYANAWYSAFGLKVPSLSDANYPYVTDDGFAYLIIDLEETGMTITDTIDIYYSGTGKLIIDQIFFANEASPEPDYGLETVLNAPEGGQSVTISGAYTYVWGGTINEPTDYLSLEFAGDGVADLSSLRIGIGASPVIWLKDALLIGLDGNPITADLTTDHRTLVIDLKASGLAGFVGDVHLHMDAAEAPAGIVTFYASKAIPIARYTYWLNETEASVTFGAGYTYGFYTYVSTAGRYLALDITADGTAQFDSFRIELGGKTVWANGSLVDINGTKLADLELTNERTVVYVDLLASGFDINNLDAMHFHFGGDGAVGTIVFHAVGTMDVTIYSYVDIMAFIG